MYLPAILAISSEKGHEAKDAKKYLVRERNFIKFDRSFSLPEGIEEEKEVNNTDNEKILKPENNQMGLANIFQQMASQPKNDNQPINSNFPAGGLFAQNQENSESKPLFSMNVFVNNVSAQPANNQNQGIFAFSNPMINNETNNNYTYSINYHIMKKISSVIIEKYTGRVRYEVGKRIRLRVTPEIKFVYSDGLEQGSKVLDLIDIISKGEIK